MNTNVSPAIGVASRASVVLENVNTNNAAPGRATRAASATAASKLGARTREVPDAVRDDQVDRTIAYRQRSASARAQVEDGCSRCDRARPCSIGNDRSMPMTLRARERQWHSVSARAAADVQYRQRRVASALAPRVIDQVRVWRRGGEARDYSGIDPGGRRSRRHALIMPPTLQATDMTGVMPVAGCAPDDIAASADLLREDQRHRAHHAK